MVVVENFKTTEEPILQEIDSFWNNIHIYWSYKRYELSQLSRIRLPPRVKEKGSRVNIQPKIKKCISLNLFINLVCELTAVTQRSTFFQNPIFEALVYGFLEKKVIEFNFWCFKKEGRVKVFWDIYSVFSGWFG